MWGNQTNENSSQFRRFDNPYKYTGELQDAESGLIYLKVRYYDPSIGRFITEDTYEGQIQNRLV
ncbi:RHS repeat-associated core domain-containing protein [Paenibacillus sp. FSL R10-2796]|uniref:RHS repeat-associated core domain-containing protein n=1 Tax=unclassified Paenibacillus TaxID=185978 RepID=UPI002115F001